MFRGRAVANIEEREISRIFCEAPSNMINQTAGRESDDEARPCYKWPRFYDPSTGRFLQSDPDAGKLMHPLSVINKYDYASNNPIINTDPTGDFSFTLGWFADLLGPLGGFFSIGLTFVHDDSQPFFQDWQIGLAFSAFGGTSTGLSAASGGFISFSNAQNLSQLEGPTAQAGAAGGFLGSLGLFYDQSFNGNGQPSASGLTLTFGSGGGLSAGGGIGGTLICSGDGCSSGGSNSQGSGQSTGQGY